MTSSISIDPDAERGDEQIGYLTLDTRNGVKIIGTVKGLSYEPQLSGDDLRRIAKIAEIIADVRGRRVFTWTFNFSDDPSVTAAIEKIIAELSKRAPEKPRGKALDDSNPDIPLYRPE